MNRQSEVEVGLMWLHLPSGAAGIHGFIPGEHGGPQVGGVGRGHLPIGDGGSIRLFEGLDPMRYSTSTGPIVDLRYEPPGFDKYGFDWAGRSTSDVQAVAAESGWEILSRSDAAERLMMLGYQLYPRRDRDGRAYFRQVLWTDQIDRLTWHVRESLEGTRFTSERCVFVYRKP